MFNLNVHNIGRVRMVERMSNRVHQGQQRTRWIDLEFYDDQGDQVGVATVFCKYPTEFPRFSMELCSDDEK